MDITNLEKARIAKTAKTVHLCLQAISADFRKLGYGVCLGNRYQQQLMESWICQLM